MIFIPVCLLLNIHLFFGNGYDQNCDQKYALDQFLRGGGKTGDIQEGDQHGEHQGSAYRACHTGFAACGTGSADYGGGNGGKHVGNTHILECAAEITAQHDAANTGQQGADDKGSQDDGG